MNFIDELPISFILFLGNLQRKLEEQIQFFYYYFILLSKYILLLFYYYYLFYYYNIYVNKYYNIY